MELTETIYHPVTGHQKFVWLAHTGTRWKFQNTMWVLEKSWQKIEV